MSCLGEEVPQGPWRGGGWAGHWMPAPLRLPHPVQQPDGRCGARRGTLWERPEQVERRSSPLPPTPTPPHLPRKQATETTGVMGVCAQGLLQPH